MRPERQCGGQIRRRGECAERGEEEEGLHFQDHGSDGSGGAVLEMAQGASVVRTRMKRAFFPPMKGGNGTLTTW